MSSDDPKRGTLTVLQVVGPSDTGKTTLLERLVEQFGERTDGRIATVKAIHHDVEPDTPGEDTHRHRTAGADTAIGITPSLSFRITPGGKGDDDVAALESVLADLERDGYDVALVEGFTAAGLPAVVLGTAGLHEAERERDGRVIAAGETADDVDLEAVLAYLTPR
ncbi:molybdopterin-guanine dinucleotide biosynthesis adapter protein [Halalkaliarchaeum desulfuricum]|uniref:Molybdopterin-guanine dinucleotide biosynthesis adapter protein n=1 Tax=Halalkaliarchaeum desulfuricum TaxID=2055893 RepID=A0A343TJ43_9EURY|nr:molybdopterin-guanine dinucleotide biosynthesis protein B [Halalkaliarchaeum desulfuricum]AUX09115.1 molybdopterin-guanine dinucleotide biosynthesis adapter protein [Halalkaliarchaeum desulfuricum]